MQSQGGARLAVTALLALSSCQSGGGGLGSAPRPAAEALLPVSDVINAIKCELADTFANGRYLSNDDVLVGQADDGKDIQANLTLSDVITLKNSASGSLEVVPLGISIGPSVSGSRSEKNGQSYKLAFSFDLEDGMIAPEYCAELDQTVRVEGDPFVAMLDAVASQYREIQPAVPRVQLGSITHTSEFSVETAREGGLVVKFLVFNLGAKRSDTRSASQALALTFDLSVLPRLNPP